MATRANLKYQTDLKLPDGSTEQVSRLQALTQITSLSINGQTNDEPGLDQTSTIPIRFSNLRRYGITARHIIIYRLAGTSPDQYRTYRRVPILDPAIYVGYLSQIESSVEYQGQTDWILVGGSPERQHLIFGTA